MAKRRSDGLVLLLLGAVLFAITGVAWIRLSPIAMGDFKVVYYSARCLVQHGDPYSESSVLRVFQGEGRESPSESEVSRQVMTRYFYPPTAFVFTVPFALLGFDVGHLLWIILSAVGLVFAACLMWDLAADYSPLLSGVLLGFLLMNSFWLFMIGNSAAIVVSFCAIAVWCFLRDRFVPAGVLCLAVSLAIKPHDSGLVWLFFLLAGGIYRKRALQTLLVVAILSLPAILWVVHVSPHWIQEMSANAASFSGVGGITDPTASGKAGVNMDSVVELQSVVSIFWNNPLTYNLVTYAICGAILLVWVVATVRMRLSRARAWLALAAIAPLSMLPIYHLQHDAKLLLLAVPACALLWAEGGATGWMAALVTSAGILVNGDIFSGIRISLTRRFLVPQPNLLGRILTAVLTRPAPLILLAMTVFYLFVYLRRNSDDTPHYPVSEQVTAGTPPVIFRDQA
jgi:hypothetical protein